MKVASLLIALVFVFSLGTGASAQETEFSDPGLTPDSPFYFLEIITEGIGTFFTFGDLKKAERYAALATERLAEIQAVVEKGKSEFAEKTLQRYEKQLNNSMDRAQKAQAKGQDTEKVMEVLARAGRATSRHLEVLTEVYEKVPERARSAIENAMKASMKGHERVVEALRERDALGEVPEAASLPTRVPEEVRERVRIRVQQEIEEENIEQVVDSFQSFEAIEAFCIETGGPPELCASAEARCREIGVTTPGECFRLFMTASVKMIPPSEEEMEELRIRGEDQEELRIQMEAERDQATLKKKATEEAQRRGEDVPRPSSDDFR